MRLERAARFGLYGTVGFLLVGSMTVVLIREIQTGVKGGTTEGTAAVLMMLAGATALSLIYLFVLVGEYVDRELADRGLASDRAEATTDGQSGR